MPLEIVHNDIIKMNVDAIVNTANPNPKVGGGVDWAIHNAAGSELLKARKKIGIIDIGKAAITPAYKLQAKYVIHTVGPMWQDGNSGERELLTSCYESSLSLAASKGCTSIAFPLISAGVYGCPSEIAIATATQAIKNFLSTCDMKVYLVVFDQNSVKISSALFNEVQSYINEKYVEERRKTEYLIDVSSNRRRYMRRRFVSELESKIESPIEPKIEPKPQKERTLKDMLDNANDTFSENLIKLIKASGKNNSEVYRAACVSRKTFSKICTNTKYKPSKDTALALAMALNLNLEETKDFIGRAEYALSDSNKRDIIIEYFITLGKYNIYDLNDLLYECNQPMVNPRMYSK